MPPEPARPLTERQARRCEEAQEPICVCRCAGRLHGTKRDGASDTPRTFFETLAADDPHYVPSAEVAAEQRRQRLDAKRQAHAEAMARRYTARAAYETRGVFD